ncbi:MAG: hypothetical protein HY701_04385 [Gemmatimonadetes bacterium]|nr:hypothetical protein [Gemmatimonadota bacterium]
MNVDSILISDYAAVDPGSKKLTIVGSFNMIAARQFPAQHEQLAVSLVIYAHPKEAGREVGFEVKVLDQQRNELATLPGKFTLGTGVVVPGLPLRHVVVVKVFGAVFPHPGLYAFEVYLDGTYHAAAVLAVVKQRQ